MRLLEIGIPEYFTTGYQRGAWKSGNAQSRAKEFKGGRPVKQLVVFDLDGTLAESKSSIDAEMSALLYNLLGIVKVA